MIEIIDRHVNFLLGGVIHSSQFSYSVLIQNHSVKRAVIGIMHIRFAVGSLLKAMTLFVGGE